jgi:hypothetical protein
MTVEVLNEGSIETPWPLPIDMTRPTEEELSIEQGWGGKSLLLRRMGDELHVLVGLASARHLAAVIEGDPVDLG